MSDKTAKDWPELENAVAGRQIEMPNESAKVNRIMEMGPIFKYFHPDAYAVTGPMGTISMNKQLIKNDKQDVNDVLAHELTHVGQGKSGFLRKFYEPNAVEDEAVNRESMRNVQKGDIFLHPERKKK